MYYSYSSVLVFMLVGKKEIMKISFLPLCLQSFKYSQSLNINCNMQTVLLLDLRSVLMVNVSPKSVQRMNHVELPEIIRLAAPMTILLGIGIIPPHLFLYEPSDYQENAK
jgi:hypothetical protein